MERRAGEVSCGIMKESAEAEDGGARLKCGGMEKKCGLFFILMHVLRV